MGAGNAWRGIPTTSRELSTAMTDAELAFRELAFDGDTLGTCLEKYIDARRFRLTQAADFVLEDEGRAARIFDNSRSSALGDHAIEQIEAAEGAKRSEHTLRQCLRTLEAAEPPMPLRFRHGRNDAGRPC